MDGPGPGDYRQPDSVVVKARAAGSTQISTWGTGREQDESPNKRKQEFHMPGPAQYNHVYNDMRLITKPHQNEGYCFSKQIRDIHKQPDLTKDPPGAGSYDPQLPKSGTAKSFLGKGPPNKEDKHNGVPSPGKHSPKYPDEAPKWSFGNPPEQNRDKRDKDDLLANLGPGTHHP